MGRTPPPARPHPGVSLHDLAVLTVQTDEAFATRASRLEARWLSRRGRGADAAGLEF